MRSLLSKRVYEEELPRILLEAVWYVEADDSYDVRKRTADASRYVAVRTLSGSGVMQLHNGKEFFLEPNSVGVFEERSIARYMTKERVWQFYWFEFRAERWDSPLLNDVCIVPGSKQERVEMERCFMSLNRGTAHFCRAAESLFTYLLADWQMRSADDKMDEQMKLVLNLMEKGRKESMSIPEMARKAGMCERSFRMAVKEATGFSPKGYMIRGEMDAAMELLRTTDMTICEIASCLDYARPSYFSRAFKKHFGVSPQFVRDEMQL